MHARESRAPLPKFLRIELEPADPSSCGGSPVQNCADAAGAECGAVAGTLADGSSVRIAAYPAGSPISREPATNAAAATGPKQWPDGVWRPAGLQPAAQEHVVSVGGFQYPMYLELDAERGRYFPVHRESEEVLLKRFGPIDEVAPVYMFPPIGWQKVHMARGLYEADAVFRYAIEEIAEYAAELLPLSLTDVLYPRPEDEEMFTATLQLPQFAQPCLFAVEYALGRMWKTRGCEPWVVVGHSLGEFCAAVFAGALDVRTCTHLVCERGRLMGEMPSSGAMMSVRLPHEAVERAIKEAGPAVSGRVVVGAVNGPSSTVLSGEWSAIQVVLRRLPEGTTARRVQTSHPDHSPLLAPLASRLAARAAHLFEQSPPRPMRRLMISSVTGRLLRDEEVSSPTYWATHMTSCVRFDAAIDTLVLLCRERALTPRSTFEKSWTAQCIEMGEGMLVRYATAGVTSCEAREYLGTKSPIRFVATLESLSAGQGSSNDAAALSAPGAMAANAAATIEGVMSSVRSARQTKFLLEPCPDEEEHLELDVDAVFASGAQLIGLEPDGTFADRIGS